MLAPSHAGCTHTPPQHSPGVLHFLPGLTSMSDLFYLPPYPRLSNLAEAILLLVVDEPKVPTVMLFSPLWFHRYTGMTLATGARAGN